MQVLESAIERKVRREALKRWGIRSLKLNVQGQRGWPDVIFFVPGGRPLMIEFKRSAGFKPYPLQLKIHARLREAGYDVHVHHDVDEALGDLLNFTSLREES